jgi:exo-beta-1,3-glucanase (GH17 family)
MPSSTPSNTDNWWCDPSTEYAFVGFSYEVSACQSQSELVSEFKDIRNRFNGRYVRLYGACDNEGFYDDVIEAAWQAGIGVHALVWFGFTGGDIWETRRDALFGTLHSNPKAPFVTRVVQFGSEPLFDAVLSASALTTQVNNAKSNLKSLGIPVTVSDMAYSYQSTPGSDTVLEAIDSVNAHILPYFATNAKGGGDAWGDVTADITWFMNSKAAGKKLWLDENGWPSESYQGVQPNSATAVTNINQEQAYFDLLDSKCSYFKNTNGGIAWFAHIYSDDQEPGYGILYTGGGKLKFPFSPKTSC